MEKRIFISHSSKDHEVASKICEALEENGLRCWIAPRDIPYGTQWAGEISKAIENSSAFLFLSSGSSNSSEQVSREIQLAIENSLTIIPIRLDQAQYSDANKYYLATIHCMIEYDAAKTHKLVADIIEALPQAEPEQNTEKSQKKKTKTANHTLRIILGSILTVLCALVFAYTFFFTDAEAAVKYVIAALCALIAVVPLFIFRKKALSSYNIKRLRINLISFTALICAAAIAAGGYFIEQKIWFADKDSKYYITLSAPSNMSATDFSTTAEEVRTRFEILMGEQRYSFRHEGDKIEIIAPRSAFGGLAPENVIKCYISRAVTLCVTTDVNYIGDYTEDYPELVSLSRDDIISIEAKHGTVEGADTETLGITEATYDYIELTLDEAFIEKNKETLEQYGDKLIIAQDKEAQLTNYFYHTTVRSEKSNVFYLINTDPLPNVNDVVIHNFTTPPLASSLNVSIEIAVKWEDTKEATVKGKNQLNSKELEGSTVNFTYVSSYSDVSEGEWIDTIRVFKERLDSMDVPYAFGRLENNEFSVAVKLYTKDTGLYTAQLLAVNRFNVRGSYSSTSVPSSAVSPELTVKETDSTAVIEVAASYEDKKTEYAGLNKLAIEEGDGMVYLTFGYSDIPILSARADINSNGEKITFDMIPSLGNISISEEHKSLVKLIEKVYNTSIPAQLEADGYSFDNKETTESDFGYTLGIDAIESKLREIDPSAEIEMDGADMRIYFDMPVSEELPYQVIERAKEVFSITDFENSTIPYIAIYFIDEIDDERARIFFKKTVNTYYPGSDFYKNGYINAFGIFSGGRIQRDNGVFLEEIYKDDFFAKYIVEDESSKAFS